MIPGHVLGNESGRGRANSLGDPLFYTTSKYRPGYHKGVGGGAGGKTEGHNVNGLSNLSKSLNYPKYFLCKYRYNLNN